MDSVKFCKICNRPAKTSTVQCVNCESMMHKSCCTRKTMEIFDDQVKCCDDLDGNMNDTVIENNDGNDLEQMRREIVYLKLLIKEKNKIIFDKCTIIKDKDSIISLLKQNVKSSEINRDVFIENPNKSRNYGSHNMATPVCSPPPSPSNKQKNSKQSHTSDVINNSKQTQNVSNGAADFEWKMVRPRTAKRKSQRSIRKSSGVVGSGSIAGLSAAPRKIMLFVSRLSAHTNVDILQKYVESNFPGALCSALSSKHPEHYSSFKITIDSNHYEAAINPNMWPEGAYISKFFFRKTTVQEQQD